MSRTKRAADAEHAATRKAAALRDHPVVATAGKASEVADQPPLIALSIGTLLLGAALRRPAMIRGGARMLASHLVATGVKTVLKARIDRTRPARAIAGDRHHVGKGRGTQDGGVNSFPSGHTAGAVAIAQAVARDAPGAALPVRIAAGGIGAMQLPRGKHYLSDIAAGAAIGWLSERIASAALRIVEGTVARLREPDPPAPDPLTEAEAHPS